MAADLRADVVVVGAGPAGAMAAVELATLGIDVLVVERSIFPREKICGDGLLEESLQILAAVGLDQKVRRKAHAIECIRFVAPDGGEFQLEGDFCTLRRKDLDALLLEEACGRGANFLDGIEVKEPFLNDGTGVGVVGLGPRKAKVTIAASLVLLATGANPRVLRDFGVLERKTASAIGVRGYFRLREHANERAMIISYDRRLLPGYGWIFPLGAGIYNVGRGIALDRWGKLGKVGQHVESLQEHAHPLSTFLRRAEPVRPLQVGMMRTGFQGARACASGLLVLGEALGLTFPFLGEGVSSALASGRLAARVAEKALKAGDFSAQFLDGYERQLRQQLDARHKAYFAAQRWFRYAPVATFLITRAARDRRFRELIREILIGNTTARAVFSLRGLGKIFLPL
ncbi:MAG: NAD(P)/FAD-dependent oxidoreductase [Syntrophobacteria bacterium]